MQRIDRRAGRVPPDFAVMRDALGRRLFQALASIGRHAPSRSGLQFGNRRQQQLFQGVRASRKRKLAGMLGMRERAVHRVARAPENQIHPIEIGAFQRPRQNRAEMRWHARPPVAHEGWQLHRNSSSQSRARARRYNRWTVRAQALAGILARHQRYRGMFRRADIRRVPCGRSTRHGIELRRETTPPKRVSGVYDARPRQTGTRMLVALLPAAWRTTPAGRP